ncbi:hypothetical protein T265_11111 [Opisthorchis viverrini]|uniref:DNA polymerase epsilon subunit 3 n=1 Tax=Opisthorchis viverrini TaxID=6198 RepID=A0A074Z464_OPIVI|nr:hypothetical protein T265_11111 [Opisthorchis viverrini]KER20302.1 hypothetical protein T265_11111 [Opisthorchis viverrini]
MSGKVDDLYLPNAVILRIIRDSLPDRTVVSREARSAISKAASSFILYVTSLASTHCEAAKRKTLAVGDILAALKDMQFEHYIVELQTFLERKLAEIALGTQLGARWTKWLKREFTDRKVRGSNPTSASRLPLSRLGRPGSIPALVLPSCGMAARHRKRATVGTLTQLDHSHRTPATSFSIYWCARWPKWLQREFTDRKVRGSNPTSASRLPCLGLGNLAVSQLSCFLRLAWRLGTKRVLLLNGSIYWSRST